MSNALVPVGFDVNPPNWLRDLIIDQLRNAGQYILAEYVRQGRDWAIREAREVLRSLPGQSVNAVRNWLYPRPEKRLRTSPQLTIESGTPDDLSLFSTPRSDQTIEYPSLPSPIDLDAGRLRWYSKINSMYRGKFKRPRYKKTNPKEITRRIETGGEVKSANCAYVGHSHGGNQMIWIFVAAMIHKLFRKAGIYITDLNETPGDTNQNNGVTVFYRAAMYFKEGIDGNWVYFYTDIEANQTYANVIDTFFNELQSKFEVDGMNLGEIELTAARNNGDPLANPVVPPQFDSKLSKIDLQTEMIACRFTSILHIQNRTPGDSNSDISTESITANPVSGKKYGLKGQGPNWKFGWDSIDMSPFMANVNSGIIAFAALQAGLPGTIQQQITRPPGVQSFQNCWGVTPVRMDPGAYHHNVIRGKYFMKVNEFWRAVTQGLTNDNKTQYSDFGHSHLFGFDKSIRTGTGDAQITIGYEVNAYYTAELKTGRLKKCTMQIVNI